MSDDKYMMLQILWNLLLNLFATIYVWEEPRETKIIIILNMIITVIYFAIKNRGLYAQCCANNIDTNYVCK